MAELKLGIALGGGGVRGASHLGIVKALHEHRIYPTIYAGTSAGSIVASLLAFGYKPEIALDKFEEASKHMLDIAYGHILKGVFTTNNIEGFVKGNKLERLLDEMFNCQNLSKIYPSIGIVATDINKGKQVIFTNELRGFKFDEINDDNFSLCWSDHTHIEYKISEVVRASCGMPTIFLPKQIHNMKLVDGGITNNLPSDVAVALGADKVLSIDLGYSGETETDGIIDIGGMTIDVLMNRVTDGNRKDFGLYLNPEIYDIKALETKKIAECYERGYKYGLSQIDNIVKYLEEV